MSSLLRKLFSIDTSHTSDVFEKHMYILAFRISLIFSILFILISALYSMSDKDAKYFTISTAVVSVGSFVYLKRTTDFKKIFWVYAVAGTCLIFGALFTIHNVPHLTDIIWILVCVWLAFVGLGKKIGIIFLAISSLLLIVFFLFFLNIHILTLEPLTRVDLAVLIVETSCACFAFGYLTTVFVKMQKYREQQIEQKSNEILVLNSTIHANERMVGIGEFTMGLAHDLNSPLSSVKFGIQNIREGMDRLFKRYLFSTTKEEFDQLILFAEKLAERPTRGGLHSLKEEPLIREKLATMDKNDPLLFIDGLIKSGVDSKDDEILGWIIHARNREVLVEILQELVIIFRMIDVVSHAGQQSVGVISGLRNFTNQARKDTPELINLQESLIMVLQILVSRFKDNINVELNISENIQVLALPRDLFQVWSNVLKNAMEAMENYGGGNIRISASQNDIETQITIENNGPEIEQSIKDHIFERFRSSKGSSNSGFGLHIVKQILDRNGWTVEVNSDEERTAFVFTIRDITAP
jgi:signal transduction histidine kinase